MRKSRWCKKTCLAGLQCGSFTLTIVLLVQRLLLDNEGETVGIQLDRAPKKHYVVNKVKSKVELNGLPFQVIYDEQPKDGGPEIAIIYDEKSIENEEPKSEDHGPAKPAFVKDVYLFSAVVGNSTASRPWDTIVVQVWEHKLYDNRTFDCCLKYRSGVLLRVNASLKVHWSYKDRCKMPVKQYYCPNPRLSLSDLPIQVSLIGGEEDEGCEDIPDLYIETEFAYAYPESIAVCTKLLYGNISADDVMTWFEIHRRMGASKVLLHTYYDLNDQAAAVLEYYRSQGFVESSPFGIPDSPHWVKKRGGHVARMVGGKNFQTWNDEQILIYDCLEKLKGYKYLVVLDIDEYIVPKRNKTWSELFDQFWNEKPQAAGFTFLVQLHITSWGPTETFSEFTVGRYLNSTSAMSDRTKHVTRPDRLVPGGMSTHQFYPRWDKKYHRFSVQQKEAVIHHYRECRGDWKKRRNITCMALDRFRDPTVADFLASIEDELLKQRSVIHSLTWMDEGG